MKQDVGLTEFVRTLLNVANLGVFCHVSRPSRADDRIPNVCEINRKFGIRKCGTLRVRELHLNLLRKCRKIYSSRGNGSVTVLVGARGRWPKRCKACRIMTTFSWFGSMARRLSANGPRPTASTAAATWPSAGRSEER